MGATLVIAREYDGRQGYRAYGAGADLWGYRGQEAMLEGPNETGKTMNCLHLLNTRLSKYPGTMALMVRQTYKSLINSACKTYENKVLTQQPSPSGPIVPYGGKRPEWYDYPNGSRLVLGGMDNPDKFLSSEFDFIYVNQAEELTLDAWEKLMGRATGRAGNAPYAQIFGDCNPGAPHHWIVERKALKRFKTIHKDNPTLYDPETGEITEQGQRTIAALKNMSGVRRKRYYEGLWAGAEGQVYEDYDEHLHLIEPFDIPHDWPRWRAIDFGYKNAFVCQWWALDHDDRAYLYREIYMTGRLVEDHAKQINQLSQGEHIRGTITDHDAEGRATLKRYGIKSYKANKDVEAGIQVVQARLKKQGDDNPRLYIFKDCVVDIDPALKQDRKPTCTAEEILGYAYPEAKEGKPEDEKPVKLNDHGVDAMRYLIMHLDGGKQKRSRTV